MAIDLSLFIIEVYLNNMTADIIILLDASVCFSSFVNHLPWRFC